MHAIIYLSVKGKTKFATFSLHKELANISRTSGVAYSTRAGSFFPVPVLVIYQGTLIDESSPEHVLHTCGVYFSVLFNLS